MRHNLDTSSLCLVPTGKGYADVVFLPKKNKTKRPAIIIELKKDRSAKEAIAQIRKIHMEWTSRAIETT